MRRTLTLLVPILFCFASLAVAETPRGTLRALGFYAKPTSEFRGYLLGDGSAASIEAQGAPGLGIRYELRPLDWMGIEFGVMATEFDFDIAFDTGNINPVNAELGTALMVPLPALRGTSTTIWASVSNLAWIR